MKQGEALTEPGECHAYLIRLWRDSPQEPWRASAKHVPTRQEHHFANPEKLFLFLHQQMTAGDEIQDVRVNDSEDK
jgi:hypothetical protein